MTAQNNSVAAKAKVERLGREDLAGGLDIAAETIDGLHDLSAGLESLAIRDEGPPAAG